MLNRGYGDVLVDPNAEIFLLMLQVMDDVLVDSDAEEKLVVALGFPGDLSPGKRRWGRLVKDSFPGEKVGPTYFSVKN
nr:hypothetical protein [Tanacetum cinerariifolium]